MKIYVAGASYRQREARNYCRRLARRGFTVTSNWVNQKSLGVISAFPKEAKRDLEEVDESELVILLTENPKAKKPKYTTGGRHVEFGYAIAKGKKVIIVGPRENVFHYIGIPQFDTFKEAVTYLENA